MLNLRVLSSLGVEQPLSFDNLPPSTTVGALRRKIVEALPPREGDDVQKHMRLIYRGRLLSNDSEALLDIIGEQEVSLRSTPSRDARSSPWPVPR